MTYKQIINDVCPYQGECSVSGCKRNDDGCFVKQLFKERNRAEYQIVELNKMVKAKEQECEELKDELLATKCMVTTQGMQYGRLYEQLDQLKAENEELKKQLESTKGLAMLRRECLEAVKVLANNANLPNISLYIDSFLNEEPQKINEVENVNNNR